jgi:alpha-glucosidase
VYIRSFADGDGDGLGDIAGIRSRLDYIARLGVDAMWINPWYPSPLADGGYDVSDYRAVDPRYGTLEDAEALLREAHQLGLRVLLDIVPNHTSDQHRWFQAALAAPPGSTARDRYLFRPGRGEDGKDPPNDWQSAFGGSAWTRVTEAAGSPGEWYLHLFAPEQPDLNWDNPDVRSDFEDILRFWFDRGVDGFRIDVANSLIKEPGLPDLNGRPRSLLDGPRYPDRGEHPHWDRPEVHDVYRAWRRVADSYPEPRVFVAEAWVDSPERLARYVRSDELHTAFSFEFLRAPWDAPALRAAIDTTLAEHAAVGAPSTWVLSNHDVVRQVSRYARLAAGPSIRTLEDLAGSPPDFDIGIRRARAAALLMLALPGGAYIYQGEELGLPEVEDLPDDVLTDPVWERSNHTVRGRDGCRVPMPWAGEEPPFGFSADGARPWLPQPASWRRYTAAHLEEDPDSALSLYRRALAIRRRHPALGDGTLRWLTAPAGAEGGGGGHAGTEGGDGGDAGRGVLLFARDPGFVCAVNVSDPPTPLPAGEVLLASGPLTEGGHLPPNTAVWLAVP